VSLEVIPLTSEKREGRFDVFEDLVKLLKNNNQEIHDGDVVVISTKYVSNSQGRIIGLDKIRPSMEGGKIGKRFHLKPEIAEIILRESDKIFGGIPGFIITSSNDIMAPNAGIDKSNAKLGSIILYPQEPYLLAEQLKRKIFLEFQIHVGVILVDSRLMPARIGTTGVAIACSGIDPVLDMRAQKDLDGNPLKVTFQAIADSLATIANYKMGEGGESRPIAIVRNSGAKFTGRKIEKKEMAISYDQCVYVRGLKN